MSSNAAINYDRELSAYIDTALWSESIGDDFASAWAAAKGEDLPAGDVSFQSFGFDADDLDKEARAQMDADLAGFIADASDEALEFWARELGDGSIGHDFWLTRNGHGAGFWDRFAAGEGAKFGRELTDTAKPFGECHLEGSDDLETIHYIG